MKTVDKHYYTSKKDRKTRTEVPHEIELEDGKKLTFSREKTAGWSVGGWYKDEDGGEFMVKFGDVPALEKMFNDLAKIAVGEEYAGETKVGYGMLEGRKQPCFVAKDIENYSDIISIKENGIETPKAIAMRKSHAEKFHRFYAFQALLSNDDLNEENFGLKGEEQTPVMIDYGLFPRFLYPEQIEHGGTPFGLASFIGHRNLNTMQLVRRRYFGHDDFLLLEPFKLQEFKPEDISYGSILLGAQRLIKNKKLLIKTIEGVLSKLESRNELSPEEKLAYKNFAKLMEKRIEWMENAFKKDLIAISDPEIPKEPPLSLQAEMLEKIRARAKNQERFNKMKWRLMPEFVDLMEQEEKVFNQAAQDGLHKSLQSFSENFLQSTAFFDFPRVFNREEILTLKPAEEVKKTIREMTATNFMLHDAIITGDFEVAKWLVINDLADPNSNRTTRNHNYQFFRLTPLHTAIAIYHDKLFYGAKLSELKPLEEMIEVLHKKFVQKNGEALREDQDVVVRMSYRAYDNFKQKAKPALENMAATKIQRAFRNQYQWETKGDPSNPIIALIAPSSGLTQEITRRQIDALVAAGFCVKYAKYPDGNVVNPQNPIPPAEEAPKAVSAKIGSRQIIECVEHGWNMMPTMGGWGFKDKIPQIVDYFAKNPQKKNLAVKMFGFSDSTYATLLQSNGICQFICSTGLYCLTRQFAEKFTEFERGEYHKAAEELVRLLKTGEVISVPRKILFNPNNKLNALGEFEFYPMHCGSPFISLAIDEKDDQHGLRNLDTSLFEPSGKYAIGLEGFMQRPNIKIAHNENADQLLDNFLSQKLKQGKALPEFIEMNLFTTRLDGGGGYNYLVYDKDSGLIEKSDFNIDKLLKNQAGIRTLLVTIKEKQEQKNDPSHTQIDPELLAKAGRGENFDEKDIEKLIDSENKQIKNLQQKIIKVAMKYDIPVIQNFRFGHSLNMSTVGGGRNVGIVKNGLFSMEHVEIARPVVSPQSSSHLMHNEVAELKL